MKQLEHLYFVIFERLKEEQLFWMN